ncbi:MAG: SDR family oxidoreductase [Eubacteriales bacterium]|nr:SDR family oxidoreductase [Eubacteriales bacterium]
MRLPFKVDLSGKTAIVTGGSGTLCSAMAWGLAKNGARVALIGRNHDKMNKAVEPMRAEGLQVNGYCCDVTDKQALIEAYSHIKEELGACEILINGAGGNKPGAISGIERLGKEFKPEDMSFMNLTEENVLEVMQINYLGTFLPIQVFAEDMIKKRKGSIINIASCAGILPLSKVVAYANAKSAIVSLTQWLSTYLGESGVRCNAIAPGFYAAEQNHDLLYNEDGSLTKRAADIIRETPMGRFGNPQDLIGPALFLASDEASGFVNGVVLSVDGGFCACPGV